MVALLLTATVFLSSAPETKQLSVYSPSANYSLPVVERNGDYVDLLEILSPLGAVTARSDGRTWKVRYNYIDGEFTNEKILKYESRARLLIFPAVSSSVVAEAWSRWDRSLP